MSKWDKPQELVGMDAAFGSRSGVKELLPAWEEIPQEFKTQSEYNNKWIKAIGDWFFKGIKLVNTVTKEGIEEKWAIRHIGNIMHSWEPKHEHKVAGSAYLLSLWFDKFEYELVKGDIEE